MKKRAILLILDSLGVGYMKDVKDVRPRDVSANTFYHILDQAEKIDIPNLEKLGINQVVRHQRLKTGDMASFGSLNLQHYGADSYAGHQEIMGTKPQKPLMEPFLHFMDQVRKALEDKGYEVTIPNEDMPYLLVNKAVVVADNIETDYGQIYNISAPLDVIPFEEVLKIGKIVRQNVKVNRVIALGGENVSVEQLLNSIERREDGLVGVNSPKSGVYNKGYQARHLGFGVDPEQQVSSILMHAGKEVTLIGKMQDVIECEGAKKIPAVDTSLVMEQILKSMDDMEEGLIAATVQETDLAGHAEDVNRYAGLITLVDKYLGQILEKMTEEDIILISADHGNDPTIGHSQHTREKTFILAYSKKMINGNEATKDDLDNGNEDMDKILVKRNIGERETLSDIAASIADYFNVKNPHNGQSFL